MFLLTKVSRRFSAEDLMRKTTEQQRNKKTQPTGPAHPPVLEDV